MWGAGGGGVSKVGGVGGGTSISFSALVIVNVHALTGSQQLRVVKRSDRYVHQLLVM